MPTSSDWGRTVTQSLLDPHTKTFIAGIRGITTGVADGVGVVIDSAGQLGTVSSSRRYKQDIVDMAAQSEGVFQLRPVTFHYKPEYAKGGSPLQYGLIAEEVEKIFPELVQYDNGQVNGVKYHELPIMLLNEVQKQRATINDLLARLALLEAERRAGVPVTPAAGLPAVAPFAAPLAPAAP
jgi:hypothetical protein